jgi:hypothetical protein
VTITETEISYQRGGDSRSDHRIALPLQCRVRQYSARYGVIELEREDVSS